MDVSADPRYLQVSSSRLSQQQGPSDCTDGVETQNATHKFAHAQSQQAKKIGRAKNYNPSQADTTFKSHAAITNLITLPAGI